MVIWSNIVLHKHIISTDTLSLIVCSFVVRRNSLVHISLKMLTNKNLTVIKTFTYCEFYSGEYDIIFCNFAIQLA